MEELVNWLTHGVGLLAAVGGFVFLLAIALGQASTPLLVGVVVYGVSLVTLYLASTLYHLARTPGMRRAMKIFDHAAIFGLIAGSWTPFLLGPLQETGHGWWFLGIVWGLAVLGIAMKLFFTGRFRLLSTGVYLGMGWLGLAIIGPLHGAAPPGVLFWLIAGGLAYTGGVVFYLWQRLPFNHGIWHGFVMAGSAAHYVAVVGLIG
ncbi:MAG: hypothetical protein EA398_17745 [Deltaproteobacteria bacterium]|nr:MAG: hypothetical protein EA398_17745 [Deltaproteobacteria bacterium]